MSDEPSGVPPDLTDPEAPASGPTFSQEGYDRLMRAQGPWLKSRLRVFSGWDEFAEHQPRLANGIKAAIAEWNRLEGPRPPLDGADLKGAYLKGVNLSRATLAGADLSYANLEGAELSGGPPGMDASRSGEPQETSRRPVRRSRALGSATRS